MEPYARRSARVVICCLLILVLFSSGRMQSSRELTEARADEGLRNESQSTGLLDGVCGEDGQGPADQRVQAFLSFPIEGYQHSTVVDNASRHFQSYFDHTYPLAYPRGAVSPDHIEEAPLPLCHLPLCNNPNPYPAHRAVQDGYVDASDGNHSYSACAAQDYLGYSSPYAYLRPRWNVAKGWLWYDGHNGYDYAKTNRSDPNPYIVAAAPGYVEFAGDAGGYGNTVIIDHWNGYRTQYSHLEYIEPRLLWENAHYATISRGDSIGRMGDTPGPPTSTGVHLHFAVYHLHHDDRLDRDIWYPTDPYGYMRDHIDPLFYNSPNEDYGEMSVWLWQDLSPGDYQVPTDRGAQSDAAKGGGVIFGADIIGVIEPIHVHPNQRFSVAVAVRNFGQADWHPSTGDWTATPPIHLVNTNGTTWGASSDIAIGDIVGTGSSYIWDLNLTAPSTSGNYFCRWIVRVGSEAISDEISFVVSVGDVPTPTPPIEPPQGDWQVRFFNDLNLAGPECGQEAFNGSYVFRDWGDERPSGGCNTEFSARIWRRLHFDAGHYDFWLFADDHARLKVLGAPGGDLVVDQWEATAHHEGRDLFSGDYEVVVEYNDTGGRAVVGAWWTGPSFPEMPHDSQDPYQWWGAYWANRYRWENAIFTRNEGTVLPFERDWGDDGPGYGLPADRFATRFKRSAYFTCGRYRFEIDTDDAGELWVDPESDPPLLHLSGSGYQSREIDIPNGEHTVQVQQREEGGTARLYVDWTQVSRCLECYDLNVQVLPSGSGAASASPPTTCGTGYSDGTIVSLSAQPNAGFSFSHWSGDASGNANAVTVTMDESKYVIANFVSNPACYSLSMSVDPSGSGTVSSNTNPNCTDGGYTAGTIVSLSALPSVGYSFSHWSGDASGSANPTTITMDSNKSVTANFGPAPAPLPDLRPYAPPGYPYPVVPSSIAGTHDVSALYAGKEVCFDWHFANSGSGTASGDFHVELWVDSTRYIRYPYSNWGAGAVSGFDDWITLVPTPGWHTVRLVTDPDDTIIESDESNNTWEQQFYWQPVAGWWGEYFNNESLSGSPSLVRDDPEINFIWAYDAPGPGVGADSFSVRWERDITFEQGTYVFSILHDDGTRLWVDGSLVLDQWDTCCRTDSVNVPMIAGIHEIHVEMVEHGGAARIHLTWQRLTTPTPTPTPTRTVSSTPTTAPKTAKAWLPALLKAQPQQTPTRTPTPRDIAPNAGYWEGEGGAINFLVTAERTHVDEFAVMVEVEGCGTWEITHIRPEPITSGSFSFTGAYYASGTFDSATRCSGQAGLDNFELPDCGLVSGGPWFYTATWQEAIMTITIDVPAETIVIRPLAEDSDIKQLFQAQRVWMRE